MTRRIKRPRRPHPMSPEELVAKAQELQANGVKDSERRAYFDRLYSRYSERELPGESGKLYIGDRVVAHEGYEDFEGFVSAAAIVTKNLWGQTVDREVGNAVMWLPRAFGIQGSGRLSQATEAWLLTEEATILIERFWTVAADALLDLAEAMPDKGKSWRHFFDDPRASCLPTFNESNAAGYFLRTNELPPQFWHSLNTALVEWKSQITQATAMSPQERQAFKLRLSREMIACLQMLDTCDEVPMRADGWPVGRPRFEELGQRLYKAQLFIPERRPEKPPHKNRVREAVEHGITKMVICTRWYIAREAGIDTETTLHDYYERTRAVTKQQVGAGMAQRHYGPRAAPVGLDKAKPPR